jgi:Zn-dependent M28 family amino/carboxypeptidase
MQWTRRKSLITALILAAAAVLFTVLAQSDLLFLPEAPKSKLTLQDIPFDGARAYKHLTNLCAIGPRIAGSPGMVEQRELIRKHFESLGAKVSTQTWKIRHPQTGEPIELANLIVEFHPDREERILLCAHYDTRPYPDEDPDPKRRRSEFLGANDGASGVALLMELGTHLGKLPGSLGVDIVLFDAEELIYEKSRDKYFIGSEHFAREYVASPPKHHYRCGVLLDMVGDKELQIYQERNSVKTKEQREVTHSIWRTAEALRVSEFVRRAWHEVRDDHLALNNTAMIPTCDIIDFDYPRPGGPNYWHTTRDVPENCSAESLAKVGWVLLEWLKGQR